MRPPVLDFEKPWQKRCSDRCRDWVIIGATQLQLPSIISGCVLPSDRLVNWIVFHWLHTPLREKKKRNSMKRRQNPKDKQCHIGGVADSEENTMSDDEEAPEKNKNKPWNHPGLFLSIKSLTRIHMAGLMKTASRSVLSAQVLGMYLLPANHGAAFIMNTGQMTSRQKFHSWQNECWCSRELWWQPCFNSSLRCFSNFSNFCKPNPLVVPVLEYYLCFLLHQSCPLSCSSRRALKK